MTPGYWKACYDEGAAVHRSSTPARDLVDRDTDGDGILDGADDQDHDDIPNIMELSRNMASGHVDWDAMTASARSATRSRRAPDGPDADTSPTRSRTGTRPTTAA